MNDLIRREEAMNRIEEERKEGEWNYTDDMFQTLYCSVCGFDFQKQYGAIGKNFIHVHHIVPVSQMGDGYVVDPIKDLIPVCPNCHAMIHRTDPPLTIEELRKRIANKE